MVRAAGQLLILYTYFWETPALKTTSRPSHILCLRPTINCCIKRIVMCSLKKQKSMLVEHFHLLAHFPGKNLATLSRDALYFLKDTKQSKTTLLPKQERKAAKNDRGRNECEQNTRVLWLTSMNFSLFWSFFFGFYSFNQGRAGNRVRQIAWGAT